MAGIFPEGGVTASNTIGAQVGAKVVALCKALFFRSNCNPRFDPVVMNGVISELVNAINAAGIDYDCSKLNNLATALAATDKTSFYPRKYPDINDIIRGTFDGAEGYSVIEDLLEYTPSAVAGVNTIEDDDVVLIGKSGTNGAGEMITKGYKMTFDVFASKITEQVPAPLPAFGSDYKWKNRYPDFWPDKYDVGIQNKLNVPIFISIQASGDKEPGLYVSNDGNEWFYFGQGSGNSGEKSNNDLIVPPGSWYKNSIGGTYTWLEWDPLESTCRHASLSIL